MNPEQIRAGEIPTWNPRKVTDGDTYLMNIQTPATNEHEQAHQNADSGSNQEDKWLPLHVCTDFSITISGFCLLFACLMYPS